MKIRKQQEKKKQVQKFVIGKEEAEEKEKQRKQGNGGEDEGKIVLVGIKMDSESRELLTWALVKVAETGDCVVALHVLPSAKDSSDIDIKSSSSLLTLVKAFDSVLAVYEGFCNLKQIELKMKICRGSSIRKVLVQEAKSYAASRLILGVDKNNRAIGYSPTSTARYCAKKLPQDCSVLAVNNGKIVYHREALPPPEIRGNYKVSADSMAVINDHLARKSTASISPLQCIPTGTISSSNHGTNNNTAQTNLKKDNSLALVPVRKPQASPSSISQLFRDMSEVKPGWPLLRKALLSSRKADSADRSKMSVVQWAMRLPSRYSAASAIHSNHNLVKSDEEVTSNKDSGAIVPVITDASSPMCTIPREAKEMPKELESLQEKYSAVCRLFSYQELVQITCYFSPDNLVGKGGSSRVFKGCLSDGRELAIKIFKPSEDAMNEFISEIEIITSLNHKNIISLFGFCFENDNLILVYDFLSRGSLEDNLHGERESKDALSCEKRYKVALGVAEALSYLHGADNVLPVIHRDVKSSNILLSDDFEPQLSDFGLAMWASDSTLQLTCNDVAGTFGYLAPEYFMYGKVNEKIDVYAFGVVLLELLSGRKPVNTESPKGQESLIMWATRILQSQKVKQLLDPCLWMNCDEEKLEKMILAASLCIKRSPRSRPTMAVVLKLLQGDEETLKWAKTQVQVSEDVDESDDEATTRHSNIQSHINLALLNIEDDSVSVSSTEPSVDFLTANKSLEEYLQGRWSRSSSFD